MYWHFEYHWKWPKHLGKSDNMWWILVFPYDSEGKRLSMHWKRSQLHRELKKLEWANRNSKQWWPFFFAIHGIVYLSSVPEGQTMNEHYYLEVLAQLRKKYEKTILNVKEQVMDSSSGQCTGSHCIVCQDVSSQA